MLIESMEDAVFYEFEEMLPRLGLASAACKQNSAVSSVFSKKRQTCKHPSSCKWKEMN